MDKILETLSQKFSAEELNEVKKAIEFTVDEKVKAKSEQEARVIAKKADEYCQAKIKEAVEKKTAEVEEIANKFCEERCEKLSKEADAKVESYKKKLEEAAEQYILEKLDEKFTERYGQELEAIEEKVITGLDKYLEYNINEKIGPALIQKSALQETYEPIVESIMQILEDKYVAPNTTGSKKIRELKAENAEIRASLQKQLDEKGSGEDWEKKYHDEHKAFEDFKQQTTQNAELEEIKKAHSTLLQEAGISADRIGAIQRITDFSGMKRDKDGKLENGLLNKASSLSSQICRHI